MANKLGSLWYSDNDLNIYQYTTGTGTGTRGREAKKARLPIMLKAVKCLFTPHRIFNN